MDELIGIDVGGTKIHAARFTAHGVLIDDTKLPTESAVSDKKKFISKLHFCIKQLMNKDVIAIGIGIPGPIDIKTGKVYPPNIPCINGVSLRKELKEYGVPIWVENDTNCFAIGEQRTGAAKGFKNVIGMTMGTGVGGAIIMNDKIYRGRDGAAGEIGHMTIDKEGYLCNCKGRGCLEMYVSGTAIEYRAERHIKAQDIPTKLTGHPKVIDILNYYSKRDKLARKIFDDTGKYLGQGLVSVINIFNPDIIVLGGSVSKALPAFKKTMELEINAKAMQPSKKVKIVRYKLRHPGAWGAAIAAFDSLGDFFES